MFGFEKKNLNKVQAVVFISFSGLELAKSESLSKPSLDLYLLCNRGLIIQGNVFLNVSICRHLFVIIGQDPFFDHEIMIHSFARKMLQADWNLDFDLDKFLSDFISFMLAHHKFIFLFGIYEWQVSKCFKIRSFYYPSLCLI
jgi:hypothetical protein